MELYLQRGFDNVTVGEIAERAGLKTRSFFRHFADKREVLFSGSAVFQEAEVTAVLSADADVRPIDAVATALALGGARLTAYGDPIRRRQEIIAASPDLQERELIKMASLTQALAEALRSRGVAEPAARLTAQAGVVVFTIAFQRWADEDDSREFLTLMDESLNDMRRIIAAE